MVAEGSFADPLPPPDDSSVELVGVGPVAAGFDMWLLGADDSLIDEDDVCGEIVLRGPSVSPGLWQPDGTVSPSGDYLRTGDIGFKHKGELYIVERIKNMIIRNGENYSAFLLERQIADAIGRPTDDVMVIDTDIRPGAGKVTALIGVSRKEDPQAVLADYQQRARTVTSLEIDDVLLVPSAALPRTTSGKKQHSRVRVSAAGGINRDRLAGVPRTCPPENRTARHRSDRDRRSQHRGDEIGRLAHRRGVNRTIEDSLYLGHDLGFDSLARIELAAAVEERTGVAISEDQLGALETVGDFVACVRRQQHLGPNAEQSVTALIGSIAASIPQTDLVVDAQQNRQLLIDGRWCSDFASLNYLGIDVRPDMTSTVGSFVQCFGTHPGWTRAVASPRPYRDLEQALAKLVGAPDSVVFPSVSLLHLGVLPMLAGQGTILVDGGSHHSILEAAELARQRGATVVKFGQNCPADLSAKLEQCDRAQPIVITVDGVYSMDATLPDLLAYEALAAEYGATLYVDDVHGVGVFGANPSETDPYGHGGGGVVQHFGLTYDNIVYVAGMSKAFSSFAGFVTCRSEAERRRLTSASTMIFSGPIPVASLAVGLQALRINAAAGDAIRRHLYALTKRAVDGVRALGLQVENDRYFPSFTVVIGKVSRVIEACKIAWRYGIVLTPAVFPAVPLDRGGLRISITAANTDAEIDVLFEALQEIRDILGAPALPEGPVSFAGTVEF